MNREVVVSPAAWRTASVVGQDRTALADPRKPAPDTWVSAAMRSGQFWARVAEAARRFTYGGAK